MQEQLLFHLQLPLVREEGGSGCFNLLVSGVGLKLLQEQTLAAGPDACGAGTDVGSDEKLEHRTSVRGQEDYGMVFPGSRYRVHHNLTQLVPVQEKGDSRVVVVVKPMFVS